MGVRSFSNVHYENIQFDTPLTLIVGYNGSGKTTIIECLKYATTGQLPPNSKGGAFIHDPKLCGEKEVKAQVRLSFKGAAGSRLVVTRSLQLTVKKLTRSMKTLDGQLLMIKDGERTTMSTRVAELDRLVPQYMGVSEAILDSVIFCHQDESLWPMSEPAALKKKFDEIFEAMKYTKAIENIKSLRKTQGGKLAELKVREETEKANKEKGARVEKQGRALEVELDELREQEKQLSIDMEAARIESGEKYARAKQAQGIVNELKTKREQVGFLQRNINDLRGNLEELEESDEWLETTLAQYEERKAQLQHEIDAVQIEYGALQDVIQRSREKLSTKLTEQGQRQAEKANHETQLQARAQLVKEAARRHAIRGYDGDLDESQIRDFVERVRRASRDKDRELERIRTAADDEERETQVTVTKLEGHRNTRTQDRVNAKQTITDNDRKVHRLQADVDAIGVDEGRQAVLEASLNNYEEQLRQATTEFDAAAWETQLRTEASHLQELELEARRLREDLLQSNRLAKERASLELKKEELKKLQQSLDTMVATHGSQLCSVVGQDWCLDTLERDFQMVLDQESRALADAKSEQEEINRDLSTAQFKCSNLSETIKKKEKELESSQATVLSSITNADGDPIQSVDAFEEELDELQQSIYTMEKDIANYDYVTSFYRSSLTTAEKHDKCRLCDRKFSDQKERTVMTAKLHAQIAKFTQDTITEELSELKKVLPKALAARSHYETYKKLSKTEIPALEEELKKNEISKASLLERIAEQDDTVAERKRAKDKVDGLKKTVETISRYRSDMSNYETDISRISTQQKLSGSSLTVDELEEQSTAREEDIRSLRSKIDKINKDKGRANSFINKLELDLRDAQTKLSTASNELEKKQAILARIEEFRENNLLQRDAIQRADVDLEDLGPQLAKAKAQYEDAKQRGRAKAKEVHDEQKILADTVNRFKMVDDAINKYVDGDGPEKLVACQKSIKLLEKEQKAMEAELVEFTAKHNELNKKKVDSERYERSIRDNLLQRKNLRELQVLENEIAELEQRNVTDDYERLSLDAIKMEKHFQKLSAERGTIIGSMRAKDQEFARSLKEWEVDYKDAAQNYREAHVKVETTKAAIEDLGQYGAALDAAIMKYHSLKMEEINRIAGELWQSTYQGTDVDTILIRSENENAASKRNYNYRVCMVKQDAEMDMRGRCSAGQRVLASIIIRLALAECFGVKCGIIALDEPTTNLDQDNIKSLAESLHNIIKIRRQQQNFQLIVITHDEEFLKYMKCPEFTDNYWRVSRDEKQKSTIEKQSVSEIMG